ncbi:MAG: nucleotidyltransferase family protein [Acidobacteriota bacterium]
MSPTGVSLPLQRSILSLLRRELPGGDFPPAEIDAALKHFECGGYLHGIWSRGAGRPALPDGWSAALARAHRRTAVDNLGALAQFRQVGRRLREAGIPFIVLKGADYLLDLYDDPAARFLTDIDLLIRPADIGGVARSLREGGYEVIQGPLYPEDRRFEVVRPGPSGCRFEFHWWIGLPRRTRIDQEEVWRRSRPCAVEEIPCRRLAVEDAFLFHAAHLADHYFGPSLKWVVDLRQMLRRRKPDAAVLAERSRQWGVRIALYLSLRYVDKLFPGEVPPALQAAVTPSRLRCGLLARYYDHRPVGFIDAARAPLSRALLRVLMIDRVSDAARLSLGVAARPAARALGRAVGTARPPWERT